MIRINLLESSDKRKKKKKVPTGAPVVAIYILVLVLEGLLLFYWSTVKDDDLVLQKKMTEEVKAKLDDLQKLKGEKDELEKKMQDEAKQAAVFDKLRFKTLGPSNLMLYLSYSLSVPPLANHSERVVQEQIGWDTRWDPDRAWFTEIREQTDQRVLISGQAISHHDTDEILKRLRTTTYLQNVRFISAKSIKKAGGEKNAPDLIEFKIEAVLNYNPDVGKEPEAGKDAGKGDKKGDGKGSGKAADKAGSKPDEKTDGKAGKSGDAGPNVE